MVVSLYYKIKYYLEKRYIRKLYRKNKGELTYSNKLKEYVHPKIPDESGNLEYILSELTRTDISRGYSYTDKGKTVYGHSHSFDGVLKAAWDNPKSFLPDIEDYSKKELELIRKVLAYRNK